MLFCDELQIACRNQSQRKLKVYIYSTYTENCHHKEFSTYSTELPKLPLQSFMHLSSYKYSKAQKIYIFLIVFLICRHRKRFVLILNLSSANMYRTGYMILDNFSFSIISMLLTSSLTLFVIQDVRPF